jgi:NAD(P)-dependent dehydrogenase (short-subunit alcohol dehydrogenase family)
VNNAGIGVPGPLEALPLDVFRQHLEVNVVGHLAVTQAFLPLVRQGKGRIVFMGSVAGLLAAPMLGAYAASKHALEAIADALRVELASSGIGVSLIEPGNVATPIWAKGRAGGDALFHAQPEELRSRYARMAEVLRKMSGAGERHGLPPERIAEVVAQALLSPRPRARYLVGRDARIVSIVRLLPDRMRDALLLRRLGG